MNVDRRAVVVGVAVILAPLPPVASEATPRSRFNIVIPRIDFSKPPPRDFDSSFRFEATTPEGVKDMWRRYRQVDAAHPCVLTTPFDRTDESWSGLGWNPCNHTSDELWLSYLHEHVDHCAAQFPNSRVHAYQQELIPKVIAWRATIPDPYRFWKYNKLSLYWRNELPRIERAG